MREPDVAGVTLIRSTGEPVYMRPVDDEGREWDCFWSEEEADAATTDEDIEQALALAGAWSDLDADEVLAGLERLRRERKANRSPDE
jgi:hypothetical protein